MEAVSVFLASNMAVIWVKSILYENSVWNSPQKLWEHMKNISSAKFFLNLNPSSIDSRWSLSVWDGLGNGLWVQVITMNWNHSDHQVIPCSYINLKFSLWKSRNTSYIFGNKSDGTILSSTKSSCSQLSTR